MKSKFIKLVQIAAVILFLFWIMDARGKQLGEWPAELEKNSSLMCNAFNYQKCDRDDWFGVFHQQLPAMVDKTGQYHARSALLLKAVCLRWNDSPSATTVRIIDVSEDLQLYLCRMKEPSKINRGAVLEELEKWAIRFSYGNESKA